MLYDVMWCACVDHTGDGEGVVGNSDVLSSFHLFCFWEEKLSDSGRTDGNKKVADNTKHQSEPAQSGEVWVL